ncbi:hypothetical protein CLAVI_000900 [Candidatus Clavichlamydia salmonicola]|uniref:hypothetical protein n=1 Tax=Candidatus Clavichlamydia salmonicola TaxID=469812 RepID=UPI00189136DF|nr:hypothetical protein [Candidatus Clavichlamydia salmonicola]MBF5051259.1 hypothetical protein [Candidatus Clavichlamydia salmonicola]
MPSINPFNLTAILVKQEKSIIIYPSLTDITQLSQAQEHLTNLVERVKQASLHSYSVLNTLPIETSTTTNPFIVTEIQHLFQSLRRWISLNKINLSSSFGTSFYDNLSQSLDLQPSSINLPSSTSISTIPTSQTSQKKPFNPRKRWRQEYTQTNECLPCKQSKTFLTDGEFSVKSATSITQSPQSLARYYVQKILMLHDSVFTFENAFVEDLEDWVMHTHQHIGIMLNDADMIFVKTKEDLSTIPHENLRTLRAFTLKSLLIFMQQHQKCLDNLTDLEIKQHLKQSHVLLMEDLQAALGDIERATGTPLSLQSPHLLITTTDSQKKIDSDQKKKTKTPDPQSNEMIHTEAEELVEDYFVGLRVTGSRFSIYSKRNIADAYQFKNFLVQIDKASLLSTYQSMTPIPHIPNNISNNHTQTLETLYHLLHRNRCSFMRLRPPSTYLDSCIGIACNILNEKYCHALGITPDPFHHHPALLKLKVFLNNPLTPLPKTISVSYISIYPDNTNPANLRIKNTTLSHPKKNHQHHWIKSIKNHERRLTQLIKESYTNPLYLICNDNSWQVNHPLNEPVEPKLLIDTILKISQYNYNTCLEYFKETSDTGEEMFYADYDPIEKTLASLISLAQKFLEKDSDFSLAEEINVNKPEKIAPICAHKIKKTALFFSLYKPDRSYALNIASITYKASSIATIHTFTSHAKKTSRYIKNIFSSYPLAKIKYKEDLIENFSLFLSLMYWGLEHNIQVIKNIYPNDLMKGALSSKILKHCQEMVQLFSEHQEKILDKLTGKKLIPLTSIKHPFGLLLTHLSKNLIRIITPIAGQPQRIATPSVTVLPMENSDNQHFFHYVSCYQCIHNANIFRIKKRSLIAPQDSANYNCMDSFNKHYLRILQILEKSAQTNKLYLECNDKAWPLDHSVDTPIDRETLLPILLSISEYNYQQISQAFKGLSKDGKKITYPVYEKSEAILSSIINLIKKSQGIPLVNDLSPIKSLIGTTPIKTDSANLNVLTPQFFALQKSRSIYYIKIHRIESANRHHILKSLSQYTIKMIRFLNTLLKETTPPRMMYQGTKISNLPIFLSLLYWSFDYNLQLATRICYKNTENIRRQDKIEERFTKAANNFQALKKTIHNHGQINNFWENIPLLDSHDHPLAKDLQKSYKQLQDFIEKVPSSNT